MSTDCFVCSQRHFEGGVLVPARPDPSQPCEHREATLRFRLDGERVAVGPLPPPKRPFVGRSKVLRHLPGHERLERMLARREAYLEAAGRTEEC